MLQVIIGRATIALNVAKHVEQDFGISMSAQTMRCAPKGSNLHSQQMKKKLLLSNNNVKARLKFARIHKYWTIDDWGRVIFLDK